MSQTPVVYRNPRDEVEWPANLLIAFAWLSVLGHGARLLLHLVGMGLNLPFGDASEVMAHTLAGTLGIVFSLVGLVVAGFIVWAGLQMRLLIHYPACVAAAAIAILPGLSPCCCIGVPLGIWALIVLVRPEVRAAFR